MKKILELVKRNCFIWQILLFALAYFATGKLGMFLAVPPGYATAIYPPSGIGLAGILLWGYRAWFGVLLGSFLLNLSIAENHAPIEDYIPVVIALVIAMGATLQAVTGAYLVKRFADFPNPLANEKNVFTFMFYGGFLSTLVNSTISVSMLAVMNQIPLANFFTNWSTWWMGDAIGVFIFAPLMLIWLHSEKDYFRHRKLVISSTIVTVFSLTVMLVVFEKDREIKQLKIEFDKDAFALNMELNKSVVAHLSILHSLESFYASTESVERDEFHKFVAQTLIDFKDVQAVGWNLVVANSQRDTFEKSVRKEGFSSFEINERDVDNNLIRANNREFYVPATFIEPLKNNESALGYDVNSNPIRREAIEKARDTGEIAITAKITLVQDDQAGILAFIPIYKNHLSHQSLQDRRQNILGYGLVIFHLNDIFTAALSQTYFQHLHLQVFDENAPTQEQRLLFSNQFTSFVLREKGLFGRNISLTSSALIQMGNRQWRFEITPTQDYFVYHRSDNSWLILLAGLVLTSISGVFVMVSTGREMVLQQMLDVRTKDFIAIDLELKRSNIELRTESDKNLALLRNASDGIAIVSDKGNVIDCSDSFCTMLGYSRKEIIGMHVSQWDVGIPKDELMHLINELFKQRTRSEFETRHIRKDGTIYDAEISGCPIQLGEEWVYFCATRDITERKKTEVLLRDNEQKLRDSEGFICSVLDSIPVHIAVLNEEGIIVVANNPWIQFGQQNGTDVLCDSVIGANYLGVYHKPDDKTDSIYNGILDVLAGRRDFFKTEYSSRSLAEDFWFFMTVSPLRGSKRGLVICRENITERKKTEVERERLLKIIDESPDFVGMSDMQANLKYLNTAAKRMVGLPDDTDVFKLKINDMHPEWATNLILNEGIPAILENGFWKSENALLNGVSQTEVPVSQILTVHRDEQGNPQLISTIMRDITERKQMEVELQRSNTELEQFAYAVSHDMRQPLRMVTSYLSLIEKALQTQLDDDTRQFLTFAVDGAKRMDSMISALLDYSRVGRQNKAFSVISSRAAVEEALVFLRPALETSGGEVEILGDWVDLVASHDELTRLFQNLIGNALKYHEADKPLRVEVTASVTANTFRVEVCDNGIGINPSQINRLFKVFSRLQARSRFEGTGVGLALCRKIVEHHGGKIGVKSEGEGLGCTFWFEIPLVE